MWCWFYNGGDGKFLKSLYIVGTGVLTPLFYEDLPYIAYIPFFKFCPLPLLLCHLKPSSPMLFLLSCFFG